LVSVVSIWEILIKRHAGKLLTNLDPDAVVQGIRSQTAWRILPLEIEHIQALNDLARFSDHTDPFDRILIAQAKSEGLNVMTADPQFPRYKINVVW
jgi:PIN domain nuclease of toxin-antitoxin system